MRSHSESVTADRMTSGARWLLDTPDGYGVVTRCLHWLMAALLVLQFSSAAVHFFGEDSALDEMLWPKHRANGFVLFCLTFVRGAWGLANLRSRPAHLPSWIGRVAVLGQLAMYGLMLLVPVLALLRAYGNGRGFSLLGLGIVPATGEEVTTLRALGNDFHGPLGWCLSLLIVGHVSMALVHHFLLRDATLRRMIGMKS
jgi:cytochrome b561